MPITISTIAKPRIASVSTEKKKKTRMGGMKLATVLVCSMCLVVCLLPARPVECGRLQDFIQNLVGGGSSSSNSNSNSNSNNANSNSNSNSNSNNNNNNNDNNDSDAAATGDSQDQQMTPMMSAMNPFMRYPQFYDSFNPGAGGFGGFPGMSFSNPMGAMSGLSPMAAMSSNSALSGAFSPASFGPASFASYGAGTYGSGSYGSGSSNPLSAFGGANGMSASSLSNVYASSPSLLGGYTPYYGRRR